MEALYVAVILALTDLRYLVSFPRYGRLKKKCWYKQICNGTYWLLLTGHFGPVFIRPSQWSITAVVSRSSPQLASVAGLSRWKLVQAHPMPRRGVAINRVLLITINHTWLIVEVRARHRPARDPRRCSSREPTRSLELLSSQQPLRRKPSSEQHNHARCRSHPWCRRLSTEGRLRIRRSTQTPSSSSSCRQAQASLVRPKWNCH